MNRTSLEIRDRRPANRIRRVPGGAVVRGIHGADHDAYEHEPGQDQVLDEPMDRGNPEPRFGSHPTVALRVLGDPGEILRNLIPIRARQRLDRTDRVLRSRLGAIHGAIDVLLAE